MKNTYVSSLLLVLQTVTIIPHPRTPDPIKEHSETTTPPTFASQPSSDTSSSGKQQGQSSTEECANEFSRMNLSGHSGSLQEDIQAVEQFIESELQKHPERERLAILECLLARINERIARQHAAR